VLTLVALLLIAYVGILSGGGAPLGSTIATLEVINYSAMSPTEIAQFVETCDTQGLPDIMLRLNTFYEWQTSSIETVTVAKYFIAECAKYGMGVSIDMHTWFTTWDTYFRDTAPNSAANRILYIDYVKSTIQSFSGSSVELFSVLNEPQARIASSGENQFILDLITGAKSVTTVPITVKFMGGYSPDTGHYAASIDDAVTVISRNTYWDTRNPTIKINNVNEITIMNMVTNAENRNKPLWITEFGRTNTDQLDQKAFVMSWVIFANAKGIAKIIAWDASPEVLAADDSYNLFNGLTPLPAFYELKSGSLLPLSILFGGR